MKNVPAHRHEYEHKLHCENKYILNVIFALSKKHDAITLENI